MAKQFTKISLVIHHATYQREIDEQQQLKKEIKKLLNFNKKIAKENFES